MHDFQKCKVIFTEKHFMVAVVFLVVQTEASGPLSQSPGLPPPPPYLRLPEIIYFWCEDTDHICRTSVITKKR